MLIFRYLAREILFNTLAVAFILLLIVVSGRFVKYLAEASAGQLEPGLIFAIIGFRVPGFLELILPLAFFIAILLSYGRLYIENEMTVLTACGVGTGKIVQYTLVVAFAISLLIGWMSLSVSPAGVAKADALLEAQKQRTEIEKMLPGKFLTLDDGKRIAYTEQITKEGLLKNVFLVEQATEGRTTLVVAEEGSQQKGAIESDYLVLENGYRITGQPGTADYQITKFKEYGQRIVKHTVKKDPRADALPTSDLRSSDDLKLVAAYQWRLSVPLLVIVVALLAVPLSRANPRQGRYVAMLPAIIVYIIYLVSLNAARSAVEDGSMPVIPGIWSVHLLFLSIALVLLSWPSLRIRLSREKSVVKAGV